MVDNNDFSDLGAVEVDDFSDLGGVPVEVETIESATPSKTESFVGGIESGATLGFKDELAGRVDNLADLAMRATNFIGLTGPSPTQVNEQLASQGVTGDLGPQGLLEAYREARNQARARDNQLAETNPLSYGAGALVGGVATAPLTPGVSGVTLGAKVASGAATGAGLGAVAGAGMSEADATRPSIDNYLDLGKDVLKGGAVGGIIGGAVPLAVEGVKAVGGKIIPDSWKTAYKGGKEGKSVNKAAYENVANQVDELSTEIATPAVNKVNEQTLSKANRIKDLNNEIAILDNEIANAIASGNDEATNIFNQSKRQLENQVKELKRMSKETYERSQVIAKGQYETDIANVEHKLMSAQDDLAQTKFKTDTAVEKSKVLAEQKRLAEINDLQNKVESAQATVDKLTENRYQRALSKNAKDVAENTRKNNELGKQLQSEVNSIFDKTSKQYNAIDSAAEKAGVLPKNQEAISLLEDVVDPARMKKYHKYFGENTMANYRLVKGMLQDDMRSIDPNVRNVARQAYNTLKNSFREDLNANGLQALGKQLDDTNQTYMRALDFEDMFLNDVGVSRVTGKQQLTNKTIDTMKAFTKGDEKALNTTQEFAERLELLDPELAKTMLPQIQEAAQTTNVLGNKIVKPEINSPALNRYRELLAQAKASSPDVPALPNQAVTQSQDEVSRLTDLLKQSKTNKPDIPQLVDPRISQAENVLSEMKLDKSKVPVSPKKLELMNELETARQTDPTKIVLDPETGMNLDLPATDLTNAKKAVERKVLGSDKFNPSKDNELKRVVQFLQNELGPEKAKEIMKDVPGLVEEVNMFRDMGKSFGGDLTGRGGFINRIGVPTANLAGKAVGVVKPVTNVVSQIVPSASATKSSISGTTDLLVNGGKELNNASDEDLMELSERMAADSPEGQGYARVLQGAMGKNNVSRSAIIMGLMQRADFRELLRKMSGNVDETQ